MGINGISSEIVRLAAVERPRIAPTAARHLERVAREYAPNLGNLTASERATLSNAVADALTGVEVVWTHNRSPEWAVKGLRSGALSNGLKRREMMLATGSV